MTDVEVISRRRCLFILVAWSVGLSCFTNESFSQSLVSLGFDRFSLKDDPAAGARQIEGLDFVLNQDLISPKMNTVIRGDNLKLSGTISVPGKDVTLLARKLTCGAGAMISTVGGPGLPSYTGMTSAPETDGAKNAGRGGNGGRIVVMVGELVGSLQLFASGGNGGDAEAGGVGLPGAPGASATFRSAGGNGATGHLGGKAGTPGDGGNGGAIEAGVLIGDSGANIVAISKAGLPGAPARNGKSGAGGPGGPSASGYYTRTYSCVR